MRIFKTLVSLILSAVLIFSVLLSAANNKEQSLSGKASSVCTITPICEKWILDNFSACQTVEEVIVKYDNFACKNFTYKKEIYLQNFDFEGFITTENFTGVCFEFTCTLKCILLVLSKNFERFSDLKSYVCSVFQLGKENHCYNVIYTDNKCYKVDITEDVTAFQRYGTSPKYFIDYTGYTMNEIASFTGDTVYSLS